jgi:hypothetical protein
LLKRRNIDSPPTSQYWPTFQHEEVSTTVYILNIAQIRVNNRKTPYELWKDRSTTTKYLKVFGSKCYIKRNEDNLGKFDSRTDRYISWLCIWKQGLQILQQKIVHGFR